MLMCKMYIVPSLNRTRSEKSSMALIAGHDKNLCHAFVLLAILTLTETKMNSIVAVFKPCYISRTNYSKTQHSLNE